MPGFMPMQLGVVLVELRLICDDGFLSVNLVPPFLALFYLRRAIGSLAGPTLVCVRQRARAE